MNVKSLRFGFLLLLPVFSGVMSVTEAQTKKLSATVDFARYRLSQGTNRLHVTFAVDAASLNMVKQTNDTYEGSLVMHLVVEDSAKTWYADKFRLNTGKMADTMSGYAVMQFEKDVFLPEGTFDVSIKAHDEAANEKDWTEVKFPVTFDFSKDTLAISDLTFKRRENASQLVSDVSGFYPEPDTSITTYAEIYGANLKLGQDEPYLTYLSIYPARSKRAMAGFGTMKRMKADSVKAFAADINIKNLPSGNYYLRLELKDKENKVIGYSSKYFQRSNPAGDSLWKQLNPVTQEELAESPISKLTLAQLKLYTASLQPIANSAEKNTIAWLSKSDKTGDKMKKYLLEFWKRRDKAEPEKAFVEYRQRVDIAQKAYGTQRLFAYETDRGRVFLQYGKPNLIENEMSDRFRKAMDYRNNVPYEVWYYYQLDEPKQNDVIFVFIQENRANNNYRLLHSTGIGEVRNREWRRVVEDNMTTNYDRLDPNDRYDPQDRMRFR